MVGARKVLVEGRGDGECPSDEGRRGIYVIGCFWFRLGFFRFFDGGCLLFLWVYY